MTKSELRRLVNIEDRMYQIAEDELGLEFSPIEFDIIPPQKMLEIMAYHGIPTNVSNWKFGRDYERQRTLYEEGRGMPYEVVIFGDTPRAYLMNNNTFGVQCLVMAHVIGHCAFFKMNEYFKETRSDIMDVMSAASKRFNEYERKYGIDEVERTIDAGHALQSHSSPIEEASEKVKREKIFKQKKQQIHSVSKSQYGDILGDREDTVKEDIELFNQKLWKTLSAKTPVEPTEDILRYIIDNSPILQDWQRDILEILRLEGQYYYPIIRTKTMNEGLAVFTHEHIMHKLMQEGMINDTEIAQYNYSNSLVKAPNPFTLNPYLIGSKMLEDIVMRWDKGMHGLEWETCKDVTKLKDWDNGNGKGLEKLRSVIRTHNDWFFMQEFLTSQLIMDLKIYLYTKKELYNTIDWVITEHEAEEIKQMVVAAFAQRGIPKILVNNGNYHNNGTIELVYKYAGIDLDKEYSDKTLTHIRYLWGSRAHITVEGK